MNSILKIALTTIILYNTIIVEFEKQFEGIKVIRLQINLFNNFMTVELKSKIHNFN